MGVVNGIPFIVGADYVTLNAPYMEMYIPVDWISNNLCTDGGTYLNIFGLVYTRVFDDKDNVTMEGILNLPSMINIFPSETERSSVDINGVEEKVIICKFYRGGNVIHSKIKQDVTNAEKFFALLIAGKIPKIIPYDKVKDVWKRNLSMNGVNLGIPSFVYEILIREIYRNPAKKEEPFSIIASSGKQNMLSYATANAREICAQNSTWAALMFEDMDSMIISSVNRKNLGKEQLESPLEKIIKY